MKVNVRRQWNDYRIAEVEITDLSYLHWDDTSGGVRARAPRPFIHGYISCDSYNGDLAHSCLHGKGPHLIKVCITKTDNDKQVFAAVKQLAETIE
jgi:hypothetical protein